MKSKKVAEIMLLVNSLRKNQLQLLIVEIMRMNIVTAKFFITALRKMHTKESLAHYLDIYADCNQEEPE